MCGIVGYIGTQDAKEILVNGLERLEYRGYDSSGIGIMTTEGNVRVFKEVGEVKILRENIDWQATSYLGIGHTRWSTHGEPTKNNAHPHQSRSGRLTLVHNGVIENEDELRQTFFPDFPFKSETDSELLVELLDLFVSKLGSVESAIQELMKLIHGSYALAIIHQGEQKIFAVKNKSPLLLGVGKGENLLGSDAMAMISRTNKFIEVNDMEYAVLTAEGIVLYDQNGNKIERPYFESVLDLSDMEKGTYPHYMLKEIEEQPIVIRRLLDKYTSKDHREFVIDEKILQAIRESDRIYIIAAGTSYHAGLVGKTLFEKMAKIPVEVHLASEFINQEPILSQNPFFIIISQSGETADCRSVLVHLNRQGYQSLTITNVENSTLYREATYQLLLHAGPEIAVASTKAYTAQIAVLAICAYLVGQSTEIDLFSELSHIANVMETICTQKQVFKELAHQYLLDAKACFYIGRQIDYALAVEAALKLKEISYIHTEGYAAGELKHGTIALIEKGVPVIAIITQKETNLATRSNLKEVISRKAEPVVFAFKSLAKPTDQFVVDDVHPLLSPLVMALPCQYLAYYAALERGHGIDKPRNLAKSVTVE